MIDEKNKENMLTQHGMLSWRRMTKESTIKIHRFFSNHGIKQTYPLKHVSNGTVKMDIR